MYNGYLGFAPGCSRSLAKHTVIPLLEPAQQLFIHAVVADQIRVRIWGILVNPVSNTTAKRLSNSVNTQLLLAATRPKIHAPQLL